MLTLQNMSHHWQVAKQSEIAAEIYLDHLHQVSEVVIMDMVTTKPDRLSILRLVASHVSAYHVSRTYGGGKGFITASTKGRAADLSASTELMKFDRISPVIQKMKVKAILEKLRMNSVKVISAVYPHIAEAINEVKHQLRADKIEAHFKGIRLGNQLRVEFSTLKRRRFILWRNESSYDVSQLHIVPSYHPAMKKGRSRIGMINGSTSSYIGGKAIKTVYCPSEPKAQSAEVDVFGGSWSRVAHPCRASGSAIMIEIDMNHAKSEEGIKEIVSFLRALLGQKNTYVSVSGGFDSPLQAAHSMPLPDRIKREPRGSEDHCVWMYRVLEKEGKLEGAFIPEWFMKEKWLEIYAGHHGVHTV